MLKKEMFKISSPNMTGETSEGEFVPGSQKKSIDFGKSAKFISLFFAGIFLVFTLFQSVYSLEEDEYAVIQTWGYVQVEETPGIQFKFPYIQKVNKVSKASKQFSVGYNIDTNESIHKESFMITNDYNFVNVDFYFEYQITDPVKYFYAAEEPEVLVKNLAQSYIRDTVGSHDVDEVLTLRNGRHWNSDYECGYSGCRSSNSRSCQSIQKCRRCKAGNGNCH